jgi:hypothetical protein
MKDLTNLKFGRLTAQWPVGRIKHGERGSAVCWLCLCACGRLSIVVAHSLISGNTKGCGHCTRGQFCVTHGQSRNYRRSPTFSSWGAMIRRCTEPQHKDWKYYGAVGVTVCDRWKIFENFLADMGVRPKEKTLGRFGDKGNYEPKNCIWMTPKEQSENRIKKPPKKGRWLDPESHDRRVQYQRDWRRKRREKELPQQSDGMPASNQEQEGKQSREE